MTETRRTPRKAPATAPGPSRVVKRTVSTASAGLAKDLDRVLKISQPDPQPVASSSRTAATSKAAPKSTVSLPTASKKQNAASAGATVSSSVTATGSKPRLLPLSQPKPPAPAATGKRLPSRASKTAEEGLIKRSTLTNADKGKAKAVEDVPEWAKPGTQLAPSQRAKEAMNTLNTAARSLQIAIKEGYQHTSAPVKTGAEAAIGEAATKWTDTDIEQLVDTAALAVRVLRELGAAGKLERGAAVEVERGAQGLALRCMQAGMWSSGLQHLLVARPHILRLYDHPDDLVPSTTVSSTPIKDPELRGNVSVPGKSATSRSGVATSSSSRKDSSLRLAPQPTDCTSRHITDKERASLRYPSPTEDLAALPETIRVVLFQAIFAALACLATVYTDLDATAALLTTHDDQSAQSVQVISPLQLAISLPRTATTSILHTAFRRLDSRATGSVSVVSHASSLELRLAALTYLAVAVDPSQDAKISPNFIWDSTYKAAAVWYKKCESLEEAQKLRQVAHGVKQLVQNVQDVARRRGEDFAAWRENQGWSKLMDFIEGVGRNLRDPVVAEWISSLSSISYSPAESAAPRPTEVTYTVPPGTTAEDFLQTICDTLSSEIAVIEQNLENPQRSDAIIETLQQSRFPSLSDVLHTLPENTDHTDLLDRLERRIQRLALLCHKILDRECSDSSKLTGSSARGAVVAWLDGYSTLCSSVFRTANLSPASASVASCLGPIYIRSIFKLCRYSPQLHQSATDSQAATRTDLEHSLQLCKLAFSHGISTASIRAGWTRQLSTLAYDFAALAWKENDFNTTEPLARLSISLGALALDAITADPTIADEDMAWAKFRLYEPKTYELHGACLAKLGQKEEAVDALVRALAAQPEEAVNLLVEYSAKDSISTLFQLPALKNVESLVIRLHVNIANDFTVLQTSETLLELPRTLSTRMKERAAVGAVCEYLVASSAKYDHKLGIAQIMIAVLAGVAKLYEEAEMPIRELRALTQLMGLIQQHGIGIERWDGACARFELLCNQAEPSSADAALVEHKAEQVALGRIAQVHQAYGTNASMTAPLELCQTALQQLLVMPSSVKRSPMQTLRRKAAIGQTHKVATVKTPARTPRTPARGAKVMLSAAAAAAVAKNKPISPLTPKIVGGAPLSGQRTGTHKTVHELARLAKACGPLISLLGMLGHTIPKIGILKVARALFRGKEDHADDYVRHSSELGAEYHKLGKNSRAAYVFSQAVKVCVEGITMIDVDARATLQLRYAAFLARTGKVEEARTEYVEAVILCEDIQPNKNGSTMSRILERAAQLERAAFAHVAYAALAEVDDRAHDAIMALCAAFRLRSRAAENVCRLCPGQRDSSPSAPSKNASGRVKDVFDAPSLPKKQTGPDEPALDDKATTVQKTAFSGKRLGGYQWHVAERVIDAAFACAQASAARGSVNDTKFFLLQIQTIGLSVNALIILGRHATRLSELQSRLAQMGESEQQLDQAADKLVDHDGPEMVELKRLRGDLLVKQGENEQAYAMWSGLVQELEGLDNRFGEKDSMVLSPQKLVESISRLSIAKSGEPLLPLILGHVLRQRAWMLREDGDVKASEALLAEVANLGDVAEDHYLNGRIWLQDAFNTFKADLFMSSLTESTIAIPMGVSDVKSKNRLSTRHKIEVILDRAGEAFQQALTIAASSGKVEDVRRACLNITLLRAFQTCLGQGQGDSTAMAANLFASSSAITLHRELVEAIDYKFREAAHDDLQWPVVTSAAVTEELAPHKSSKSSRQSRAKHGSPLPMRRPPITLAGPKERVISTASAVSAMSTDSDSSELPLREFWTKLRAQHTSATFLTDNPDLAVLPPKWAVVSISVSEDRRTMFISRHQRDKQPLLFCLPLDRQARREGEDDEDTFTLEMGRTELEEVMQACRENGRRAKTISDTPGKATWWAERYALDKRLEELCANMEKCWLGGFKAILQSRPKVTPKALSEFGDKLDRVFSNALSEGGHEVKRGRVKLDIGLLENFLALGNRCEDEEIEDLVYFILDIYQFHGVPVALAELDLDQLGIDVKSALADVEAHAPSAPSADSLDSDYLFLALDKNVSGLPWESIPCLRGKSVSRVPSLPFLLGQLSMADHLPAINGFKTGPLERRRINTRKTFYILNPSGDLKRTEDHFKPWIEKMVERAGWQGIVGRSPTQLEMSNALKEYDLVIYFGHGGAEQYIHSHHLRHLPKCAAVMLWGCSSGSLREQGDFDRTGTAWDYMVAGAPNLLATLWDVTDKDIDRLSNEVLRKLHLDTSHVPDKTSSRSQLGRSQPSLTHRNAATLPLSELSTVQAVNRSRDECKLKYLTGAAVVSYGIPVWLH